VIGFSGTTCSRESCNISHGPPGEAKEILKEFADDPFGIRRRQEKFSPRMTRMVFTSGFFASIRVIRGFIFNN
jgi:hypothetical protein